jgi:hypothetical protein
VDDRIRTGDRLDHNQELYQLSYVHRATLQSSATFAGMGRRAGDGLLRSVARPASATGAGARGTLAIGGLAVGAAAVGGFAIGRLSVGRLAVRRASFGRLEVEELEVGRLRVREGSEPH